MLEGSTWTWSGIEKQIEAALGPDFEKKIEAWAEKFGKEIEEKFGDNSEFAKKMEALGKEMEKKFGDGSEFAKKMEAIGKEMEKKFGPGSEFEKKMKEKFGPGSEFEKKMKEQFGPGSDFEKKMKEQLGPGSEFEKKMKAFGDEMQKKAAEKHEAQGDRREARGQRDCREGREGRVRGEGRQPAEHGAAERAPRGISAGRKYARRGKAAASSASRPSRRRSSR